MFFFSMSFWMLKEKPSRWWASGRPPHSAALRRQLRFWKRRPSSGRGVAVKGADFQCFQGCWCIYTKRYRSVEQLMRILPGIYAYNMCIYRLYTYIDMCVVNSLRWRWRERERKIITYMIVYLVMYVYFYHCYTWADDPRITAVYFWASNYQPYVEFDSLAFTQSRSCGFGGTGWSWLLASNMLNEYS